MDLPWDLTVDQYVQKMERLKVILSQPEFSKSSGEKLIKRIGNFVERCKDPVFHIAFVGTIKAGKSTLINALLGRNLASTSVTPETAVLTKFRSSKQDYIKVTFYTSEERNTTQIAQSMVISAIPSILTPDILI